jgi:hypothetical protein
MTITKSKKLLTQTIKMSTTNSSQMMIDKIKTTVDSLQKKIQKVPAMVRKNYLQPKGTQSLFQSFTLNIPAKIDLSDLGITRSEIEAQTAN